MGRTDPRTQPDSPDEGLLPQESELFESSGDRVFTGEVLPAPVTTSFGRRQARLAEQRRRRRRTLVAVLSASLLVIATGLVLLPLLARGRGTPTSAATPQQAIGQQEGAGAASAPAADGERRTLLLVRYSEPAGAAVSTTLFSLDPSGSHGVVFVPTGLLIEVPGVGLERLGLAQQYGGASLVEATIVEGLGVEIDTTVAVSDEGLVELLDRAGDLTVDVGEQPLVEAVPEGEEPARFEPGEQTLNAEQLARYWQLIEEDETPREALPRQQQVLIALLERMADDPAVADGVFAEGAPELASETDPREVREFFTDLAEAVAAEEVTFAGLPVEPFGGSGTDGTTTYRLADDAGDTLKQLLDAEARVPDDE